MKSVRHFLRSLRRGPSKQQADREDTKLPRDRKIVSLSSLRSKREEQKGKLHESWPPNEADYRRVEYLRDREEGWEWEMWRLW